MRVDVDLPHARRLRIAPGRNRRRPEGDNLHPSSGRSLPPEDGRRLVALVQPEERPNREARVLEFPVREPISLEPRISEPRSKILPFLRPPLGRRSIRSRPREPELAGGPVIRGEERTLLALVGKFRVIALPDLGRTIYGGDERALRSDLRYLERKNLVAITRVNRSRDSLWTKVEHIEVVTLRPPSARILRQSGAVAPEERIYAGLVKPAQAEHDSLIYSAYLKEVEHIAEEGGRNPRVQLDLEIGGPVLRALHEERIANPERELSQIKRQVAWEFNLPYAGGRILMPDARIEYELEPGSTTGSSDIEVVTSSYSIAGLRAKAEAGFRLYASARDRAYLGAEIEDSHQTLHAILEL